MPVFNVPFTARYNVYCWQCGGVIHTGEAGLTSKDKYGDSGPAKHKNCSGAGNYPEVFNR